MGGTTSLSTLPPQFKGTNSSLFYQTLIIIILFNLNYFNFNIILVFMFKYITTAFLT